MCFTTLYFFSLIFYNNRSSHNIHSSGREITCINMYNSNNNKNNNDNNNKGSIIFYQEGGLLKIGGGSGTLSKIKRGDQKIFSN